MRLMRGKYCNKIRVMTNHHKNEKESKEAEKKISRNNTACLGHDGCKIDGCKIDKQKGGEQNSKTSEAEKGKAGKNHMT